MSVAICISGHIRSFDKCYNNIYDNFISVLEKEYDIDFYVSIWDVVGDRSTGWNGEFKLDLPFEPKDILIEKFDRNYFLNNYKTNQWINYPHLSNHTTLGDSVSMWYKIETCLNMVKKQDKKYDLIARLRPDIIFQNKFSKIDLENAKKGLVIPKWHGKYIEISNTITDYFALGTYDCMEKYMSVFSNLNDLLVTPGVIHTGEGLLDGMMKEIKKYGELNRINDLGFSVLRPHGLENVVSVDN